MNGISQQRNVGFGLNPRQFKSFLNSPVARELGVSLRQERKMIPTPGKEELVNTRVLSLMQNGDVLTIKNKAGASLPLVESGKGALQRLAERLTKDCGKILPSKISFANSVCFRPLSQAVKEDSQKLIGAITKAAQE